MSKKMWSVLAGLCGLGVLACCSAPSVAQAQEKPPLYSYVSNWQIPRANWPEMAKGDSAEQAMMQKALEDGTLVGYGNDQNLVHQPDGWTHDDWFASTSQAGILKILAQLYKSPGSTSSVLASATKHWDLMLISHYYNWKPGASWKSGYVAVASYKLKKNAPDNAIRMISKDIIAPVMEKLLADGTIVEYEIDTEAVHTSAPGSFMIVYVCPEADGLDKVDAAVVDSMKTSPLSGPLFGSAVDMSAHRDEIGFGNGVFK
ncbi:MAG TPA: hypothetical protein VMV57_07355 [Terracidiphilus sp.]|nr:hypothetical protein [Terracidiphilus sp.]